MPSLVVTRTYSSAARSARSFDSRTLMPPNSTKGRRLSTWIEGVIATVVMEVLRIGSGRRRRPVGHARGAGSFHGRRRQPQQGAIVIVRDEQAAVVHLGEPHRRALRA